MRAVVETHLPFYQKTTVQGVVKVKAAELFGYLIRIVVYIKKLQTLNMSESLVFLHVWISAHLKVMTAMHILHALIYMAVRGWLVILTGFPIVLRCQEHTSNSGTRSYWYEFLLSNKPPNLKTKAEPEEE